MAFGDAQVYRYDPVLGLQRVSDNTVLPFSEDDSREEPPGDRDEALADAGEADVETVPEPTENGDSAEEPEEDPAEPSAAAPDDASRETDETAAATPDVVKTGPGESRTTNPGVVKTGTGESRTTTPEGASKSPGDPLRRPVDFKPDPASLAAAAGGYASVAGRASMERDAGAALASDRRTKEEKRGKAVELEEIVQETVLSDPFARSFDNTVFEDVTARRRERPSRLKGGRTGVYDEALQEGPGTFGALGQAVARTMTEPSGAFAGAARSQRGQLRDMAMRGGASEDFSEASLQMALSHGGDLARAAGVSAPEGSPEALERLKLAMETKLAVIVAVQDRMAGMLEGLTGRKV